jgi:hypothetical protein
MTSAASWPREEGTEQDRSTATGLRRTVLGEGRSDKGGTDGRGLGGFGARLARGGGR